MLCERRALPYLKLTSSPKILSRLLLLASECVFHAVRDTGASKEELAHSKSVTSLGRECGNRPTRSRMPFLRAVITGDRMP